MAVVVQCFHCNAILELDDGFRGGVCRCGNCGSLLQVPKGDAGEAPARAARPAGPPGPTRPAAAPQQRAATAEPGVPSSGSLDPTRGRDLGGISSGLGQIHKTMPLSHKPAKVIVKDPGSADARAGRRVSPTTPAGGGEVPLDPGKEKAKSPASSQRAAPRTPAWLATLLIVAAGAAVGAMVYICCFQK